MRYDAPYRLVGSDNLAVHLHPDHFADLRASGLRDETIRAAGVYSLAPGFIDHFFSRKGQRESLPKIETALCFPYQGGTFARIKLFPALGKWKYAQPPGTSARLYLPFPIADGALYVSREKKRRWQHNRPGSMPRGSVASGRG